METGRPLFIPVILGTARMGRMSLHAAQLVTGGILMPWLVGVTSDWSSLRLGLATSTACPLLMAFVLLWLRRRPAAELSENHDSIAQAA